jgi:uncharacterized membrane protein HdeD (DUF308 family)
MGPTRFLGIVLLVGGVIVLGMAYQHCGSFASLGEQTKHLFTGGSWDNTSWMIVIGALSSILGLVGLAAPMRHAHFVRRVFHRRETRIVPAPAKHPNPKP